MRMTISELTAPGTIADPMFTLPAGPRYQCW
jgi:hypothetical protein